MRLLTRRRFTKFRLALTTPLSVILTRAAVWDALSPAFIDASAEGAVLRTCLRDASAIWPTS